MLRAEVEIPEKASLAYRETVRRCMLKFKAFQKDEVLAMAAKAGIPEDDLDAVVADIGQQVRGLHEGNVVRFRFHPADLEGLVREHI